MGGRVVRHCPQLQEELRTVGAPAAECRTQAAGTPPRHILRGRRKFRAPAAFPFGREEESEPPGGRGVCPARLGGLDEGAGELGWKELIGAAGCSRRES